MSRAPTPEKAASSPTYTHACEDTAQSFCARRDAKRREAPRRNARPPVHNGTAPSVIQTTPLKQPTQTCSHTWILPWDQENAMRTRCHTTFPFEIKNTASYTHALTQVLP